MTDEQLREAWRYFEAAVSLTADARIEFIEHVIRDPEVRAGVIDLLSDDNGTLNTIPSQFPPASEFAPGVKIGKYELISRLGCGGSGVLYAAKDLELDRNVALKFLNQQSSGLEGLAARLIQEARAASPLNHPNIVTLYEVLRAENGRLAIVTELIDGQPLRAFCGRPLPWKQVLDWGEQAATALAVAHGAGLLHRDIKPENLMLRNDGYLKLLDFGLAKRVSEGPRDPSGREQLAGTLKYMSPEQLQGGTLTPATDIFSLGIVLYELSAGRHPFDGPTPLETAYRITVNTPERFSHWRVRINAEFESLLIEMLAKTPEARPAAAEVARRMVGIRHRLENPGALWRRRWALVLLSTAILLALARVYFSGRVRPAVSSPLNVHPLTAQLGWEEWPSFSDDGSSIAFNWTEQAGGRRQIYIAPTTSGSPRRLDGTEDVVGGSAWSPDGRRIAFVRARGRQITLLSIGALGGAPVKIADLEDTPAESTVAWSPDGRYVAVAANAASPRTSIFAFDVETGSRRRLTEPPPDVGDVDPQFSPNGEEVSFVRQLLPGDTDIYVVSWRDGKTRRITWDRQYIMAHSWAPDGRSLIVSRQKKGEDFRLWQYDLQHVRQPVEITDTTGANEVALPRRVKRLAWDKHLADSNIYRVSLSGGQPQRLIATTERDEDPDYSADGRIAFRSDRSGSPEIWIAAADGSNAIRVSAFNGPTTGSPRWSPDCRSVAFDSRVAGDHLIFVAACPPESSRCSEPKLVTPKSIAAALPSWSADGRSIYFASRKGKQWQVWKQSLDGGSAVQVTTNGGFAAHESRDGKWLYFSKVEIGQGFWRVTGPNSPQPYTGEELLVGSVRYTSTGLWDVTPKELFFLKPIESREPGAIEAYDFASRKLRTVMTSTEYSFSRGLSVSPDERWIVFSRFDRSGSNIMVADLR